MTARLEHYLRSRREIGKPAELRAALDVVELSNEGVVGARPGNIEIAVLFK